MTTSAIQITEFAQSEASQTTVTKSVRLLRLWFERARQRQHLAVLTAEQLDDIGISPKDARTEVAKPMWRA